MLESSPKQYANQIFNEVRELSKPVHDLREELSKPVHDLREEDITLPTCSVPELRLNSVWSNKAMVTRTRSCGCPNTDQCFWDAQMKEVSKYWLRGPFDSADEVA
jgi:hypothetical protein